MEVNIYDPEPIKPIARFKDNLSILTENKERFFQVDFIEPLPRSSTMVADLVFLDPTITVIAANGTIAKRGVPILQVSLNEMLHLRWEPLDDVEGILHLLAGQPRFQSRGVQARVSPQTYLRDPNLATTTFWILGGVNLDMNLEARNLQAIAQPTARFQFFGYRYVLTPLTTKPSNFTSLPAQGR